MKKIMLMAGMAALIALAACSKKTEETDTHGAVPAPVVEEMSETEIIVTEDSMKPAQPGVKEDLENATEDLKQAAVDSKDELKAKAKETVKKGAEAVAETSEKVADKAKKVAAEE